MIFATKVWHFLVALKDGLVLLFMLLFFSLLYGVLTVRPSPGQVREGALLLRLKGSVVEEPEQVDPLAMLLSQSLPAEQYRARDLVRALDAAAKDARIKAVALDLSSFTGGGLVHMTELGAAMDRVRAARKPVLTYAVAYTDDGVQLAAHASEAWINPMGAAFVAGPGGQTQYFKALLDRLKINVHVFKVGTFKDAVEPYEREAMSDPSRAARAAVLASVFDTWKANVKRARPKANIDLVTGDPVGWFRAAGGNGAQAARNAGLVDRVGDRVAFGRRLAAIAGKDTADERPGAFAHTPLKAWLAANPVPTPGKKIAVVTVAGEIVDGEAGPGTAGGDRIADLLDSSATKDIAGLVVRVDSPGGSAMASERIRTAIERVRARGLPVAVSMANVAASGGYWVATPASRIFAEPGTITGSIGVFAVLPTFERTLADYGVQSDGVRTTPLSGQPDLLGGLSPEAGAMLQASIESNYGRFLGLVAKSRGKSPAQVDSVGQGRIWDGGTARQLGLVDQFGTLDDALAWTAGQAKLKQGGWHPVYLGEKSDPYVSLLEQIADDDEEGASPETDLFAVMAAGQREAFNRALANVRALAGVRGAQAYCLACPPSAPAPRAPAPDGIAGWLRAWLD